MSNAPSNIHEMLRAGYKRLGDSTCKGCKAPIAWFLTNLKKKLPVNLPIGNNYERVTPHWQTCPKAEDFKGPERLAEETKVRRQQLLRDLHIASGALVVIGLYPEGDLAVWMPGLDPEDTRNGLIAAANRVRWRLRPGVDRETA